MKKGLFIFLTLLSIFSVHANIEISEVLPNPAGDDGADLPNGEWVELFNDGNTTINLTGYVLKDNNDRHRLPITLDKTESLSIEAHSYAMIYRNGDSDFSLNNRDGDQVRLFDADGNLINQMEYTQSTEGRTWSNIEDEWVQTDPTPGEENIVVTGCEYELSLSIDALVFQNTSTAFTVEVMHQSGVTEEVTVRGAIKDLFDQPIKEYRPWTDTVVSSSKSKAYSPRLKEGVYVVEFWVEELECDEHEENNRARTLLAVNPQRHEMSSSITIEKIYLGSDKKAAWGNQFTAKVVIYKGNDTKKSGQMWVEKNGEKVSKTSKISMEDQFKEYPLIIPIQLEANCNQKIADGDATLVVEALGLRQEMIFPIKGVDTTLCKNYLKELRKLKKEYETKADEQPFEFGDFENTIEVGNILSVPVVINNKKDEHDYTVWSYIFRGNTCYSCNGRTEDRDENEQEVHLDGYEREILDFFLKVDDEIEEGEYKLKVKIRKDDQKTVKELTKTIYVARPELKKSITGATVASLSESQVDEVTSEAVVEVDRQQVRRGNGFIVYQSSSEKAKELIPYVLLLSFVLIIVILWRKE